MDKIIEKRVVGRTLDIENVVPSSEDLETFIYNECEINRLKLSYHNIKALHLRNCKIKVITIEYATIRAISIQDCIIGEVIIESNLHEIENIYTINVNTPLKQEGSIGRLTILADTQINRLSITSVHIEYFNVRASSIQRIHLDYCLFRQFALSKLGPVTEGSELIIERSHILWYFNINLTTIETIRFDQSKGNSIVFSNNKLNKLIISPKSADQINFDNCIMSLLEIDGTSEAIQIVFGRYKTIYLNPENLKSIFIGSGFRNKSGTRLMVSNLDLSGYSKFHSTSIQINDIQIGILNLNDFDNLGSFEISNAVVEQCSMILTRLTKSTFNSINFGGISLLNSIIDEAKFANIIWPNHHLINEVNELGEISNNRFHSKLAEAYRQLKIVCLNSNDKVNSLAFYRHEMNHVWKGININWRENITDWLILGSNKVFSDFGQSLKRPILWLFSVHTLMFILLYNNYELPIKLDWKNHSWPAFIEGVGLFLNLINPVHSSTVQGESIFGITDFLMRVFSSYFIYYFIKATRKFNMNL